MLAGASVSGGGDGASALCSLGMRVRVCGEPHVAGLQCMFCVQGAWHVLFTLCYSVACCRSACGCAVAPCLNGRNQLCRINSGAGTVAGAHKTGHG